MSNPITLDALMAKVRAHVPGALEKPKNAADAMRDCPKCGGFGWVQSPMYNMHWLICPCVVKREQMEREKKDRFDPSLIGLHPNDMGLTWEQVQPGISDGMKALEVVRPFYERGYGIVYLWGTWGQAKTLIGKILTATAHRDGKRPAYANVSSVLDNIRLAFDEQEHKATELLRRIDWWVNRDVLFLDEMDKSNDTPWAQERLFQLIDQRYTHAVRQETLTVIASNKSHEALDGYLKSRLHDRRVSKVVYLHGTDGREVMPDGNRH